MSDSLPTPAEQRSDTRRAEDRSKIERVSVRGLLALLLGGAGIALAIAAMWLHYGLGRRIDALHSQQTELSAQIAQLQTELQSTDRQAGSNAQRLAQLDTIAPQVAELAGSVAELRARAAEGQRGWVLSEAHYLMEIASRRLAFERDAGAALAALQMADARMESLRDPSLAAVRRQLASEIQALRAFHSPDIDGLLARLSAAELASMKLPVIGAIADRYRPEAREEESSPGFARAWQLFRSSLTNMISIRRIGKDAVELVSLEEQEVRRHHLQMLFFGARLAAMRADQRAYRTNIDAAGKWLSQMFDPRDAGVAGLHEELRQFEKIDLAPPLPDISESLKLVERRQP